MTRLSGKNKMEKSEEQSREALLDTFRLHRVTCNAWREWEGSRVNYTIFGDEKQKI